MAFNRCPQCIRVGSEWMGKVAWGNRQVSELLPRSALLRSGEAFPDELAGT